jgi:hypothetical protein
MNIIKTKKQSGLWEFETTEVEIGTFKTIDECFAAIEY